MEWGIVAVGFDSALSYFKLDKFRNIISCNATFICVTIHVEKNV